MKKNILTIMMTLLFTSSAFAGHCPIGVDDSTIIQGLDILSEEINSFVHSDKAMKKSYKKLCRIEKILKQDRSMNCRALPAEITDADLLQFIDDIAQEINDSDHRQRKLFFTSIKLNRLNRLLVKRRTAPQVDDVAVLEINLADPFNFGNTTLGTTLSATFTVTNSGTADATAVVGSVLAPFSFRGGSYPGTGGTCGAVINTGQACTIVLEFTPTVVGTFMETLEIGYDNGVEADLVTKELQGTGF